MSDDVFRLEVDTASALDHRWMTTHTHALINPLQVEKADWQDLPVEPLVPKALQTQAHLMPLLVRLEEIGLDARVGLLDRVQHHRDRGMPFFSALLASETSVERLANHLKRQLVVRRSSGQSYLLRFHDPLVFRHLRWLLTPQQLDGLLGPVDVWAWQDVGGIWRRHRRGDETIGTSPRLDSRQWDTLNRLGLLNRSLSMLEVVAPELKQDNALSQQVDALLAEASDVHGLREEEDCLLYAEQAVRYHPRIHCHAAMSMRLRQAREGGSYADACSDLDECALGELAASVRSKRDMEYI